MHRMVFIDEVHHYDDIERMSRIRELLETQGFTVINPTHIKETTMHNSRNRMVLASALSALGGIGSFFAEAAFATMPSFTSRYGNNPKSLNGSYRQNSNAAKQKRAAVKRRNIAKHGR